MPRCKMCGSDMIVTIDNICLICNPPTEKQIDAIVKIMVLIREHIRETMNIS